MNVIAQGIPSPAPIPGVSHATWAGQAQGLQQLSVWRQSMQPGAATPAHSHDCDEVVLCLAGQGELHIDGRVQRFGANETLILPRNSQHQIFNTGALTMETLGVFGATPVNTFLPDGEVLPLPWSS